MELGIDFEFRITIIVADYFAGKPRLLSEPER